MNKEYFDIINREGKIIGKATREECHGDRSLAHRTVHVLVFNSNGELFLQKRPMNKDIQPGKWDTSVGGHLDLGETFYQAVRREMKEELGIDVPVEYLYDYWMCNEVETEYVHTYTCTYDGIVNLNAGEIDDGRFWSREEIEKNIGTGVFTPNFEQEYQKYLQLARKNSPLTN